MGVLRFILAISVVISHAGPIFGFTFVGGQVAVQAFYIISGFYMALILNEKYIGVNDSYKLFISNRFLRLYPIYWLVLFLTIAYCFAFGIYSKGNSFGQLDYYIKYFHSMSFGSLAFLAFTNMFLFLQDAVMFLGINTTTGHLFFTSNFKMTTPMLFRFLLIQQAWTIGVELAFYLIAPFIARKKLSTVLLLISLSLILRAILYFQLGLKNDPWTYRFFPTELVFFLLGIVSYNMYKKLQHLKIKSAYLKITWLSILLFTICFNFLKLPGVTYVYISAFFISLPYIFILTKKWKRDTYIGELSYPIYISHLFLLNVMYSLKKAPLGGWALSASIVSVLFAMLLNKVVTKRIERIRQRRVVTNVMHLQH